MNEEIIELLTIVNKRNELCSRRNSVRSKIYRLESVSKNIAHNNKIESNLKQISRWEKNKDLIEEYTDQMLQILRKDRIVNGQVGLAETFSTIEKQYSDAIYASVKNLDQLVFVPKKYENMPKSELRLTILKLKKELADIELETAELTMSTRRRVAEIKRKLNVDTQYCHWYNRIDYVTVDGRRIDKNEIKRIVDDHEFEKIILRG